MLVLGGVNARWRSCSSTACWTLGSWLVCLLRKGGLALARRCVHAGDER